jgi:hypothetical protein
MFIGLWIWMSLCGQPEMEPNNSLARATVAHETLPAVVAQILQGSAAGEDRDCWEIPLDYHTPWYCEGKAHFMLQSAAPVELAVFGSTGGGGYHLVGRWTSVTGFIDTGDVPLEYYWKSLNKAMAVVQGGGAYKLTYW